MNIKTPDYKAQAENLRATLLSYIDCMQEVQLENEDLKKENENLKYKLADYGVGWNILKIRNEEARNENEELKDQLKKINANTASLVAKIHELETILNIYEGRKHD